MRKQAVRTAYLLPFPFFEKPYDTVLPVIPLVDMHLPRAHPLKPLAGHGPGMASTQ